MSDIESKDGSAKRTSSTIAAESPSIWLRWLAAASLAAMVVTLIELLILLLPIGYATSSPLGMVAFAWSSHALLLLGLVPVAAVAAIWEKRRWTLPLPTAATLLAVAATLVLLLPLTRRILSLRHNQRDEFPLVMQELPSSLLTLLLVLACCACWLIVWPLAQRLQRRMGERLSMARVLSGVFMLLACLGHWTAYVGLEPLNLGLLAGVCVWAAAGMWMLALGRIARALPKKIRLALCAPALLFVVMLPLGASGLSHSHGAFLLFNHSIGARTVVGRVHDLFDFDRDGTAATWVGGTDCAPFDAERGPGIFDVPGDGIDQDCSGHDRAPSVDASASAAALQIDSRCVPARDDFSLLLITVDAWRFDTMFSGATSGISRFAKQALFYARAYAPANLTRYSIASLLSGQRNDDIRAPNPLRADVVNSSNALVKAASAAGMKTVALHHLQFSASFGEGFGPRSVGKWLVLEAAPQADFIEDFRSASLTNELLAWLDRIGNERFFAWVHYTDPHAPYLRTSPGEGNYLDTLAYTDYHVGRALSGISERGLDKSTVIAITADHGEELGEYRRMGHGTNVYESTAHVPLVLWVPGCRPEYIEDPVSLNQVAPTFAKLAGFELPGHSLLSVNASPPDGVVSEAIAIKFTADERFFKRAFIYGRYKLIADVRHGGQLLFDLVEDPAETNNIWYEQETIRETVLKAYATWQDAPSR